MTTATADFAKRLDQTADDTEALLAKLLSDTLLPDEITRPKRLMDAMRYSSLGGGKRLRPFLVVESSAVFGVPREAALLVGAALECIHCYSLIHDDLPAMDNSDLRRGRPTLHKKTDDATAILAGDGLLTLAFDIVTRDEIHKDANWALGLFVIAAVTDALDGYFARLLKQDTPIGRQLDPLDRQGDRLGLLHLSGDDCQHRRHALDGHGDRRPRALDSGTAQPSRRPRAGLRRPDGGQAQDRRSVPFDLAVLLCLGLSRLSPVTLFWTRDGLTWLAVVLTIYSGLSLRLDRTAQFSRRRLTFCL